MFFTFFVHRQFLWGTLDSGKQSASKESSGAVEVGHGVSPFQLYFAIGKADS